MLYIGVRNKFCQACTLHIPQDQHACYKNWNASSSEMETDILLEGFTNAERLHGIHFTKFIGDGDSSVHPTLIQNVPGWGHYIQKLECANRICKCYRGVLEQLVKDKPSYKGIGGLTLKMRKRLISAARCAIKMRSKESDRVKTLSLLKKDLINGPRHCFGIHTHCSPECSLQADLGSERSRLRRRNGSNTLEEKESLVEGGAYIVMVHFTLWCNMITGFVA